MNSPTKKVHPKQAREQALAELRNRSLPPDPLGPAALKKMGIRLGIGLLIVWVVAFLIQHWIAKAVAGALTIGLAVLVFWALRFARRSRAVQEIVREGDSPEARKAAIEKLETGFKKGDSAALIAKAQLQQQDDPRAALKTLEQIDLKKEMGPVADEARAQRAMIHLVLSETDEARGLADGIDLGRHKDAKTKAMLASIVGEAWARTGAAKKAVDLLETFDPDDDVFKDLRAQLLRARAFGYAWANNGKQMKVTLRKLASMNPQYLSGFITKKKHPAGVPPRGVHPMLEKEAFDMISRSGMMPRKMEFRRG